MPHSPICVVIPTYNNEKTIRQVVLDVLNYSNDVIVVCDGSTDSTLSILSAIQGITLISYEKNRGKGYALKTAFAKALEMGYTHAVTLDADGQHYPSDLLKFFEAHEKKPEAFIVGCRCLEGVERSGGSSFANKFSNFWYYVQTGRHVSDTQSGYRLYPLRVLSEPVPWLRYPITSRYEAELELLVYAAWADTEIVEIPIGVYYPPLNERVSHFRPFADFARISLLNTVLCAVAWAYVLPMRLIRTIGSLLFFVFFSVFVVTPAVWLYVNASGGSPVGPAAVPPRISDRINRLLHWLSRMVMIKIGIPGTRFTIINSQHSPLRAPESPCVVISNHQSHLDLMCLMVLTSKIVFLTNDWVWNNPFYGFMIRHAEYYPVSEGIDNLLPKLKSLVERGYSIAVFPEGTRSEDCTIGRFHQGAFYIAEQLGLDILSVFLKGPGKVLPKKAWTLRKGHIRVKVGSVTGRDELGAMGDLKRQASEMRKRYIHEISSNNW